MGQNTRMCELCHKSTFKFCTIINSLSVFDQDKISIEHITNKNDLENITADESSENFNADYKIDVKKETLSPEDVNEEKEDMKEERGDDSECEKLSCSNEEYMCKNEEIDIKMDDEELEDER